MRTRTSATGDDAMRRCGFTLIEALVVLALVALLATMIVPRIGRTLGRRELDESAARLVHLGRTLRELAIARGQVCALAIEVGGQRVSAVMPGQERGAEWQPLRLSWLRTPAWPKELAVASLRTPDGRTVTSGTHYVRFLPDGTSSGAAVQLTMPDGGCAVVIHPHSGHVERGDTGMAAFDTDQFDLGD